MDSDILRDITGKMGFDIFREILISNMDSDIFREISNMDPVWMALSLFRRGHYQQVGNKKLRQKGKGSC